MSLRVVMAIFPRNDIFLETLCMFIHKLWLHGHYSMLFLVILGAGEDEMETFRDTNIPIVPDSWYHVCMGLDTVSGHVRIVVNGKVLVDEPKDYFRDFSYNFLKFSFQFSFFLQFIATQLSIVIFVLVCFVP